MTEREKEIMNSLMAALQRGELTPAQLCQGIADLIGQANRKPQDILYLQARNTSPESQVVGMMQIEGGKRVACPPDPEMFLWVCGRHESFQNLGGQSWPLTADCNDTPYGFPTELPRPGSADV